MRRPSSAALALAVALLAACGTGADGDAGAAGQSSDAASTEVDLVVFGDPEEAKAFEELAAAFSEQSGDIDVAVSTVADEDDLLARLTTSVAGGQVPDAFLVNFRSYGRFAVAGALEPVGPYLDASEVISADDLYEPSLAAFRYDGEEQTCLPQNISSLVTYYNAELFEAAGVDPPQAGWTWDDFLETAQALNDPDNEVWGVGVAPRLIRVAPFVWSNGGEFTDDDARPTRLTLDEGPAREALDFFLDLSLQHGVVPPDAEEQSVGIEDRFIQGGLGMYLDSRRVVPGFREAIEFEWDVAPLPVAPGGEPASILHADAFCMTSAGDAKDATWQFIEYALSEPGQTLLARTGRSVPANKAVAESPVFLEPEEPPANSQVWIDAIPGMRATPHVAAWSQVESEGNDILEGIYYGRIDREQGIEELISTTTPLFAVSG